MILVVEDDPLARRAIQSLFAANGYPCKAVNSAEDALEALDGPDQSGIAMIDIDLPGMNGVQLVKQLQVKYPRLSCTLMSANDHDLSATRVGREVAFFAKPLDLKRLLVFLGGAQQEKVQKHH